MKAIVNSTVCSLLAQPTRASTLVDESLYGMVVDILDRCAPGWYRVRTHYQYEGMVSEADLILDPETVTKWEALPKEIVYHKNTCDVLSQPKVQGYFLQSVPRGGLVSPIGDPEKGWQKVMLADGQEGYMPAAILAPYYTTPFPRMKVPFARPWWTLPSPTSEPTTAGAVNLPSVLTALAWYLWPICSAALSSTGTRISGRASPSMKSPSRI